MYNDDSNRSNNQNQGQGFVRRQISPNNKYNGDKPGSSYQSQGGYAGSGSGNGGGYNNGGYSNGDRQQSYGSGERSYSSPQRRRPEGGSGGGYRQGGYGYNSRNNNDKFGGNDRLIRQNDIIIKLLKEIRDRLPAPAGGTSDSDGYGSEDNSYSKQSYSSASSYSQSESGDESDFEAAGGQDDGGDAGEDDAGDADDQDGRFNS